MDIQGSDERWENWMQFVQSRMVPPLTSHGFKKAKVPSMIFEKLQEVLKVAIRYWDEVPVEKGVQDAIYNRNGLAPKILDVPEILHDVHKALLPMHEDWVGFKLSPTSIYGVRIYQNTSSLVMHCDRVRKWQTGQSFSIVDSGSHPCGFVHCSHWSRIRI